MRALKKITACVAALSLITVSFSAAAYNDVPADYQYGEAIAFLTDSGIVRGDGNGNFAPKELLTRAEFVTMLDAAFDIGVEGAHGFGDVPEGAYYESALGKLQQAGIVSGKADGIFAPEDPVTHEEAVKMIVSAYELVTGENIQGGVEVEPTDYKSVSLWAKDSMDKAMAYRIPLVSENNTISPTSALTRGEAAELVTNALLCFGEAKAAQGIEPTKIIQNKLGNVYFTTERVNFELSTDYSLIKYEVRDFYNMVVEKGYAKSKGGTVEFDFTDLGIGHYSFAAYNTGDDQELCKTFFCIIDEYDFSDIDPATAKFGINTHLDNSWQGWDPKLLDLAYVAGARIFRDASWWGNVEREKGVYNSSLANNSIDYAKKYNMSAWDLTIQTNSLYDGGYTPYSEEGIQAQANLVNGLAECWGDRMGWIDILNEYESVSVGPESKKPETLYKIVKRCYEVAKPVHPEVNIGVTAYGSEWDEEFCKLGALNYVDYLGVHTYPKSKIGDTPGLGPETDIKDTYDIVKNMVDKYNTGGRDVKICLNESGAHTANYSGGVTYREQAEYAPRILASALSAGFENIIWYSLMNDGHDENINEQNYGLLYGLKGKYGDYAPKESYQAFCVATRKLSRVDVKETITDGKIYQYVFTTNDGKDLSVLNALPGADVALYTDEPVKITNIMGKEDIYTPVNGKIYLTLTTEPVYVEGTVTVKEEKLPVRENITNTIVNSTAELSIEADSDLNAGDITAEFNGIEFGVGEVCDIETTKDVSDVSIVTVVKSNGKPFARLYKNVQYKQPYDFTVNENLYTNNDLNIVCDLEFDIFNNMDENINVSGIKYQFGDVEGIIDVSGVIPAKESQKWNYSFDKLTSGLVHNAKFSLICDEVESDDVDFEGNYDYNIMPKGKMVVDGVVDEGLENLENCLYIPSESMVKAVLQPGGLTDKEDYDAQAWLTYDDKNLYICVDAADDNHKAPQSGSNIWSNDCIQFAFYADGLSEFKADFPQGMDRLHYYEFGVSLLDSGSVEKACWRDVANGTEPVREYKYQYAVKRDETTKHTVYEVEIPWDTIYPISPERVEDLRMSVVVVENDGSGRDGWLEWGGGIAYSKDVSLFKHVHLLKK
ncbi:MAG: S-layer homology domain-containing protein [Monoglobaceae bacterium]